MSRRACWAILALGVSGQLQDEQAGIGLPPATDLDQAVGQAAGLNDFGLQGPPLGDVVEPARRRIESP